MSNTNTSNSESEEPFLSIDAKDIGNEEKLESSIEIVDKNDIESPVENKNNIESPIENATEESTEPPNLLEKKLESIQDSVPRTKEEFYRQSFVIFNHLNEYVQSHQSETLNDINHSDVMDFVQSYINITEFDQVNTFMPVWELVTILFSEYKDYSSPLADWLDAYHGMEETTGWKAIQHYLIRGNLDNALELLQDMDNVEELVALIEELKTIRDDVEQDALYKEKWTHWHQWCSRAKETLSKDVAACFAILAGDDVDTSFSFFEKVIGSTLYTRPQAGWTGLNSAAQQIEMDESMDCVDSVCAYLLRGSFDDAIGTADNVWLETHLAHILIVLGMYDANEESVTVIDGAKLLSPAYYSIKNYATMIAEEFDMWNEAIGYLSICQSNAEVWVIELLGTPVLPTKYTHALTSVLEIAKKYNMVQVQRHIHWSLGQRYESYSKIREATIEYGYAHDVKSLDRIAHEKFSEYLKRGTLYDVVVDMEELKECPHYSILIQYRLFRQHLENKEWKDASNTLLELLKNKQLPTKFETVLLIDNLRILQESTHYYVSTQVLELLSILKQITKETENNEFISRYYTFIQHTELSADVVVAKLRESLAYKAATAPEVF